ncbi:HlyD family secretion protein [Vibrio sp. HA2012]|uniref:efflux RND transporter periplasmic adaptor subunit n=1 Tax=Vibrio sp. HA2012 TaxID=1971595 RepID=UPI000C2B810B|nr:HlyD family secretion protein [Vibrio sp. HA2012]PJC85582.1 HlyD family secretion protein [Vibrio sp. HA2012]
MKFNRKYLFFPILALGVLVLIIAVKMRPDLPVKPAENRARLVETIPLTLKAVAPRVIGYGKAVPKVEWKAIAEVSGKLVYRHPELEKGRVLEAGTEILRIDPLDYELKLAQVESELSSNRTQLARLNLEEQNLRETLKIEQNRLALSKKELERKQNLRTKGLASQSELDQQEQSYLSQQKVVLELNNQLSLYPSERQVAQAQIHVSESQVAEARRSLEKTSVRLPQTMRIAQVDIEDNQVVNLQQTLVVAHGIRTMEVEAQFSIHDMQTIAASLPEIPRSAGGIPQPDMAAISAVIELKSGSLHTFWPARVARLSETVDPNQATVGVILEVDQDYARFVPGESPLLVNGMFVQARIEGQANPCWVIPERALHGDKVYIKGADNRLQIRPVSVVFRREHSVVVEGDFTQGEALIVNDLLPAIEGMLLKTSTGSAVAEGASL